MKLCYIVWRDAQQEACEDPHRKVVPSLVELHEVGWLLAEDDDIVVIGMEMDSHGEVEPGRWRLHVPKAMIQQMKVVDLAAFLKVRGGRKRKAQ